jgi:hypothetical protein
MVLGSPTGFASVGGEIPREVAGGGYGCLAAKDALEEFGEELLVALEDAGLEEGFGGLGKFVSGFSQTGSPVLPDEEAELAQVGASLVSGTPAARVRTVWSSAR